MTLLDKYELLKKSIPLLPLYNGQNTENCKFTDYTFNSKNCYYCFGGFRLEDSMYSITSMGKNLIDCYYAVGCEVCYECLDSNKCYNSAFLYDSNNCNDCNYCALCISCSDCFGCVGLTHKQYCIFNKQYTKDEYLIKLAELKKGDPEKYLEKMLATKKAVPHPASQQYNNQNCPYGDYVYDSKNSYWCFNCYSVEDCGYGFDSGPSVKKSWDVYWSGDERNTIELSYEMTLSMSTYNCSYLVNCDNCTNCFYSSDLRNCSDCFGCVALTNKKYCILNNQLSKEKYEKAVRIIKKELGWKVE
ncbi:MAG: hypothetical protein AAB583_03910 [Patescibacteria group bacterium]